jgi:hypothetical protein
VRWEAAGRGGPTLPLPEHPARSRLLVSYGSIFTPLPNATRSLSISASSFGLA